MVKVLQLDVTFTPTESPLLMITSSLMPGAERPPHVAVLVQSPLPDEVRVAATKSQDKPRKIKRMKIFESALKFIFPQLLNTIIVRIESDANILLKQHIRLFVVEMKTLTDKEAKLLSRADLDKAAKMFLSNWLLFLLLPFAAYFISLLVIHRTSETYAAKMQIILKSGEIYDYQNSILQGLGAGNSYQSYTEVESQKKVLRSSNIISEVLDKLNLDVAYYIEGRLKTTEYFSNIPFEIIPYKNDFGKKRL